MIKRASDTIGLMFINLALIGATLFINPSKAHAEKSCVRKINNSSVSLRSQNINVNIRNIYNEETLNCSDDEVSNMNMQTLSDIQKEIPLKTQNRAQNISLEQLNQLFHVIKNHPIVSPDITKYERGLFKNELGYCFGRATYAHLVLLKMGLQKESIQKIWAVGSIKDDKHGVWQFHVATMAYTKYGWVVLDLNTSKVMTITDWVTLYRGRDLTGKIRFYNTDPSKFGLDMGKYNPTNLGLNLDSHHDWYKNYFRDMMISLREENLEDQGLHQIN
ncbi:MAG: hypothetical protein ACK41T_06120 [Pseudobdellovibrio sp.]